MSEQTKALLEASKPWKRGIAWWIIGAEGAVLALIGIYFVADPEGARTIVRQVFGWFLLINSVLAAVAGIRSANELNPGMPYRMLSAGIGLAVGVLVVAGPISDFIDDGAAKVILAFGLLGFGLIGLAGALATRAQGGVRRGVILANVLYLCFAAMFFFNARSAAIDARWFGYFAIIGGLLAMGFAFALYQSAAKQKVEAQATAIA